MNKKLIALAVAGACVAPEAIAQTANPVTLYGRAYATFESVEARNQVGSSTAGVCATPACVLPVVRRNRVTDQSSLLGVRGTEDLGGGLKAFFQLETQFKLDQNDTTFAGRNSAVGLQGGWGSVLMGRWDTPFKTTTIAIDPYGDLTIGGITAALNGSGVGNIQSQFDRRDQNVVQYWSPTWAGISVRLSYSANEGRTVTSTSSVNPRSNGASITYTGGPIYAGYAYHELKDQTFASFTVNATGTVPPPFTFAAPTLSTQKAHAVFGNFTFGPVKVGALYEKIKRSGFNPAVTATTPGTVVGFADQKAWMANIVYTIGNHQLIYQYSKAKDGGQTIIPIPVSGGAITLGQPECRVHAPGYQYNFSRRTFFLAQYVDVDNNGLGTCNLGTTVGIVPGQDPRGWSVGLRHIF